MYGILAITWYAIDNGGFKSKVFGVLYPHLTIEAEHEHKNQEIDIRLARGR